MLAGNSRVTTSLNTISWSTSPVSCVPRPCSRLRSQHSKVAAAEPIVTLSFVTLEAPSEPLVVECSSGEQLRACMLENKVGAGNNSSRACYQKAVLGAAPSIYGSLIGHSKPCITCCFLTCGCCLGISHVFQPGTSNSPSHPTNHCSCSSTAVHLCCCMSESGHPICHKMAATACVSCIEHSVKRARSWNVCHGV